MTNFINIWVGIIHITFLEGLDLLNYTLRHELRKLVIEAASIYRNGKKSWEYKSDGTEVTSLDILIHQKVSAVLSKNSHLLSEEGSKKLQFPCFILDPIDGTKDLLKGLNECSLSLGYYRDAKIENSQGYILNPFTDFEIGPHDSSLAHLSLSNQPPFSGMVSRSEWEGKLFSNFNLNSDEIILFPRGSIAFKLGLLASGGCDFVFTLHPKNIWDIAAGTSLCYQRGIHLYSKDGLVTHLNDLRYSGPLLWCRNDNFKFLSERLFRGI